MFLNLKFYCCSYREDCLRWRTFLYYEGNCVSYHTRMGYISTTTKDSSLNPTCCQSRALSLRNLASGYVCGRVFPAGVGPGSSSRNAANWLPLRFGLSVEMRRRYGWLRMVLPGVRLFRAPTWCTLGGWRHARGREKCRGEPGSALSGGYIHKLAKMVGSAIVDEPGES